MALTSVKNLVYDKLARQKNSCFINPSMPGGNKKITHI